jgi:IclR family acetate operon transcriptional repressor
VRAAERALQIQLCFTGENRLDWTLEKLAQASGLPKSTTHRLLETLTRQGFVEPGRQHGAYRLGLQAAVVGNMAIRARRPDDEVHQLLEAAVNETGESVGLSVLHGVNVVILDKVASPRPLHWNLGAGASLPAHCSAAGKALLSVLDDDEVVARFGGRTELPRSTARSIGSVDELLQRLRRARSDGYAVDDEELELGLRCVALPVRRLAGRPTHAIGLSAPASRLKPGDAPAIVATLQRACAAMQSHIEFMAER